MIDWLTQPTRGRDRRTAGALWRTDGARRAAGVNVGWVKVVVPAECLSWGGEVHGEALLKLESAMYADRVTVTLRAEQDAVGMQRRAGGGMRKVRRTTTLHEFTRELAGAGTVQTERMPFSLPLPVALQSDSGPELEGQRLVGDGLELARGLRALTQGPVRWSVDASVVLPRERNIRGRVDLAMAQRR